MVRKTFGRVVFKEKHHHFKGIETIWKVGQKEKKMKCNVGKIDKIIRVVIGVAIIAVGLYFKSWWGVVGIVPILTSACGKCPAYMPWGISTCKTDPKEND